MRNHSLVINIQDSIRNEKSICPHLDGEICTFGIKIILSSLEQEISLILLKSYAASIGKFITLKIKFIVPFKQDILHFKLLHISTCELRKINILFRVPFKLIDDNVRKECFCHL